MLFALNFFAVNSVIPKKLLFKKYFLEIGPFINLLVIPFLIISNAISKNLKINLLEFFDIFLKAIFVLYFTSIRFIVLLLSLR